MRDSLFRNHNYSDFWNDSGGGESIEKISEEWIVATLIRSFRPSQHHPGRHEGIEPAFDPILPLTLSVPNCEGFIRASPLPVAPRDFYLSKLFQFHALLFAARFGDDPLYRKYAQLQEILDRIPAGLLPPDATVDWVQFWWDSYVDCIDSASLDKSLKTLSKRLEILLAPAPDRRGPEPDSQAHIKIRAVTDHWTRQGLDWKNHLREVCAELDRQGIRAADGQGGKLQKPFPEKLDSPGGTDLVRKAIRYALKASARSPKSK